MPAESYTPDPTLDPTKIPARCVAVEQDRQCHRPYGHEGRHWAAALPAMAWDDEGRGEYVSEAYKSMLDWTPPPGECVEEGGYLDRNGYRRFGARIAARAVYEREVGPIPQGYEVDHLCRNRGCVNLSHLEAVTKAENTRRAAPFRNTRRTHCPQGHEYTPENSYQWVKNGRSEGRRCKTCAREQDARRPKRARSSTLSDYGSGRCPECQNEFRLKADGTLRYHRGNVYSGGWRTPCEGVGKLPVSTDPPLATGGPVSSGTVVTIGADGCAVGPWLPAPTETKEN